jgi:hypothetical protein
MNRRIIEQEPPAELFHLSCDGNGCKACKFSGLDQDKLAEYAENEIQKEAARLDDYYDRKRDEMYGF